LFVIPPPATDPGGVRLNIVTRTLVLLALAQAVCAQAPRVGDINLYGLRKTTGERVLHALELKTGAALPPSKGAMEERIEEISGVVQARVEAICCEGASVSLFIGIEEKGAPHFDFHPVPAGNATLPPELMDTYHAFLHSVQRAAQSGNAAEDLTAGHSLMADPSARALQENLADFAAQHVDQLRQALRADPEPEERAAAAMAIGYAPSKPAVINDLQYALQDVDDGVRANAVRSLKAIAVLAAKQPDLGIRIQPTWFVEMLNSIVLSDRIQSADALVTLTDRGDPAALDLMRQRALAALAEMAQWKTLRYALPPFLLMGRIAGLPDAAIQQSWENGDREAVIRKALATAPKLKRG
jgi:hypothetical protein